MNPRLGEIVLFTGLNYMGQENVRPAIVLERRFDGTILLRVLWRDNADTEQIAAYSESPKLNHWHR